MTAWIRRRGLDDHWHPNAYAGDRPPPTPDACPVCSAAFREQLGPIGAW